MASQHDETTTLGQVSEDATQGGCPVAHGASLPHPASGDANQQWWKNRLNLKILAKEQPVINPHDPDFDYPAAFETLDLDEVKKDIAEVLTTSKAVSYTHLKLPTIYSV